MFKTRNLLSQSSNFLMAKHVRNKCFFSFVFLCLWVCVCACVCICVCILSINLSPIHFPLIRGQFTGAAAQAVKPSPLSPQPPPPVWLGETGQPPFAESSFLSLYPQSHSFCHYLELMTIGKGRDVDQYVNRELWTFTALNWTEPQTSSFWLTNW